MEIGVGASKQGHRSPPALGPQLAPEALLLLSALQLHRTYTTGSPHSSVNPFLSCLLPLEGRTGPRKKGRLWTLQAKPAEVLLLGRHAPRPRSPSTLHEQPGYSVTDQ